MKTARFDRIGWPILALDMRFVRNVQRFDAFIRRTETEFWYHLSKYVFVRAEIARKIDRAQSRTTTGFQRRTAFEK